MPTILAKDLPVVNSIRLRSEDYSRDCNGTIQRRPALTALRNSINHHPARRLVSLAFLYSYYLRACGKPTTQLERETNIHIALAEILDLLNIITEQ